MRSVDPGTPLAEIGPLVTNVGSDSQSLDDALELLVLSGMRIDQAIGSLIPAAEGLGGRGVMLGTDHLAGGAA